MSARVQPCECEIVQRSKKYVCTVREGGRALREDELDVGRGAGKGRRGRLEKP